VVIEVTDPDSSAQELLSEVPALALADLLGVAPPPRLDGELALPLLWHWLYLMDRPRQSELGDDGHRYRPDADGRLTARMFAGGEVTQFWPLCTGAVATVDRGLVSSEQKLGTSGRLRFEKYQFDFVQDGRLCVRELRTIVYRTPSPFVRQEAAGQKPEVGPEPEVGVGSERAAELRLEITPPLLMRFSALTYNAHRIHYDVDYCREVEGYPGLVVHGPLQALAMAEAARLTGQPTSIRFRLMAPLFLGEGFVAQLMPDGRSVQVADSTGRVTAMGHIEHTLNVS
jgi:3-methylfumaryl-CoA hydratase